VSDADKVKLTDRFVKSATTGRNSSIVLDDGVTGSAFRSVRPAVFGRHQSRVVTKRLELPT
jgi:hypothetical protein